MLGWALIAQLVPVDLSGVAAYTAADAAVVENQQIFRPSSATLRRGQVRRCPAFANGWPWA